MTFKGPFKPKLFYDSNIVTAHRILLKKLLQDRVWAMPNKMGLGSIKEPRVATAL